MKYRTTRRCDQDVVDLYVRGASEFGIDQAELYHHGLIATFELLAANPRIARKRTEFKQPVRMHPYQAHMIVYAEQVDGILIIRVLHGRQDWERHLDQ